MYSYSEDFMSSNLLPEWKKTNVFVRYWCVNKSQNEMFVLFPLSRPKQALNTSAHDVRNIQSTRTQSAATHSRCNQPRFVPQSISFN